MLYISFKVALEWAELPDAALATHLELAHMEPWKLHAGNAQLSASIIWGDSEFSLPRTNPVATLWKSCHFKLDRKRNQTKKENDEVVATPPPLHLSISHPEP